MFEHLPKVEDKKTNDPENLQNETSISEDNEELQRDFATAIQYEKVLLDRFRTGKAAKLARMLALGSWLIGAAYGCASAETRKYDPERIEQEIQSELKEKMEIAFAGLIDGKIPFSIYEDTEGLDLLSEALNKALDSQYGKYSGGKIVEGPKGSTPQEKILLDNNQFKKIKNRHYRIVVNSKNVELKSVNVYRDGGSIEFTTGEGRFYFPNPDLRSRRQGSGSESEGMPALYSIDGSSKKILIINNYDHFKNYKSVFDR